jgi:hypothetical protein
MDESVLQEKLTEAMKNMTDFFRNIPTNSSSSSSSEEGEKQDGSGSSNAEEAGKDFFEKMAREFKQRSTSEEGGEGGGGQNPNIPNPEDIHNHLKGLFEGKLGSLAKELIEELSEELKDTFNMEDMNATSNPKEVFAKMMKNPEKFMKIVKKINERFQEKMKRGDISQEEIMKEAGDMLKKLKEMGGNSKEMNDMFKNMAKSMGQPVDKNAKVDVNAMNRMMKSNDIKERLRAKMTANAAAKQAAASVEDKANYELEQMDADHLVYRPVDSERGEKSGLKPPSVPVPIVDKAKEAAELDALVAEIEAVGAPSNSNKKKKANGKKKK